MADFDSWSRDSLVRFAYDATQRLADQKAEIKVLRSDLRAAMDAYRTAVKAAAPPRPPGA